MFDTTVQLRAMIEVGEVDIDRPAPLLYIYLTLNDLQLLAGSIMVQVAIFV